MTNNALAIPQSDGPRARAGAALLDTLPTRVRAAIFDRAVPRLFRRGEALFWQGDHLHKLPVMVTGHAKLMRNTEAGREVVVDLVGPGDMPCWPEILKGDPVTVTLIALNDCRLSMLPTTPIRHCICTQPRVALAYAEMVSTAHDTLTEQIAATRAPSVPARLGGILMYFLKTQGDQRTGVIPACLRRQDLADAAGTTVETATRLMRRWEQKGIVETRRDGVVIHDPVGLAAASEGGDH